MEAKNIDNMEPKEKYIKIRLYGFSQIFDFPCLCIGKHALVFKIQWSPVKKKFCTYHWVAPTSDVITHIGNGTNKFRFFGFMYLKGCRIHEIDNLSY